MIQSKSKLLFATICSITLFLGLQIYAAPTCTQNPDVNNLHSFTCCDSTTNHCETDTSVPFAQDKLATWLASQPAAPTTPHAVTAPATQCMEKCNLCNTQKLQSAWPTSPIGQVKLTSCSKLGELVKYLYGWGVSLGGIAVFIALVIAGFEYITSIGNPGKMKEAVERIESAALGLALLLGSYAIFNVINPNITTLKGNFDVIQYGDAFTRCTSRADCCFKYSTTKDQNGAQVTKKDPISDCSLTNWNCCPPSDTKCMQTGNITATPAAQAPSGSANGQCCCSNDDCAKLWPSLRSSGP